MVLLQRLDPNIVNGEGHRRRLAAPVGVGVFGAGFTALLSWIPSPWYDEAATVSAATRSLPDLTKLLTHVDAVHGLYYLLMHVWFDIVGYSPLTLRLPSAIATGIAAGLLVVLVRRLADRRTALAAGIVFCLLPRVTWMGGEGRSYAITAMLAVALTLVFTLARQLPGGLLIRVLLWLAYAAVAAIACTTFVYLALLVLANGVTVVLSRANRRRDLIGWAVAAATAGLTVLPLAIAEAEQGAQIDWIKPLGGTTWGQILVGQWFVGNDAFAIAGWALAIAGTVLLILAAARARPLLLTALPWLIVPTAVLLLATLAGYPLYSPRYVTFCTPAIAILIGVAIATPRRTAVTGLALAACFGLTHAELPGPTDARRPAELALGGCRRAHRRRAGGRAARPARRDHLRAAAEASERHDADDRRRLPAPARRAHRPEGRGRARPSAAGCGGAASRSPRRRSASLGRR